MSTRPQKVSPGEQVWSEHPANKEMMKFFLMGYERLVFLADEYLLDGTSLKKRHELNKEYIRFRPRVVDLFQKISKGGDGPIILKRYCPPPEDLLMSEGFLTTGDGFQKMDAAYGDIKWLFEGMGIAITHAPADFQDHLKEIDRVLSNSTRDPEPEKTSISGKTIRFDDDESEIVVGDKHYRLNRMSPQRKIAKIMLSNENGAGYKLPWETIHRKISPKTPLAAPGTPEKSAQKELIKTAVRGINAKIKKDSGSDLFNRKNGYIVRNF